MGRSRRIAAILSAVLVAAVVAGCGSSKTKTVTNTVTTPGTTASAAPTTTSAEATTTSSAATATWSLPNANLYNTRTISSPINSSNVSKLKVKWTAPLTGAGSAGTYANTPVWGPEGTIYMQNLAYNVFAVDSKTGKTLWTHDFELTGKAKEEIHAGGPNGVTYSEGVIYGVAPTYAFALEAATGKLKWRTPTLSDKGQGLDIAPQVHDGKVYLATASEPGGGLLYSLSASTGEVLWSFHSVKTTEPKVKTFFEIGTGGAWNTPAIGPDGTVYYGLGNPYQTITTAIDHPSRQLYTDSTIALNPNNGTLKWFYQANPDDFHDWDMQISPIYVASGVNGQPTIVDGSKDGRVYAFNAESGKLLWQKSVGDHNGHDHDDQLAFEHKLKMYKFPVKSIPSLQAGVETNMAVDEGVVYVPVVDLYSIYKNATEYPETQPPLAGTGDVVALELSTGKVLWDHKLRYSPYGDMTVTNDLVFTTTYSGQLIAFNRKTGAIAWETKLSAGSNASVSIDGNLLVTAAGLPEGKGEKPEVVAYELPS